MYYAESRLPITAIARSTVQVQVPAQVQAVEENHRKVLEELGLARPELGRGALAGLRCCSPAPVWSVEWEAAGARLADRQDAQVQASQVTRLREVMRPLASSQKHNTHHLTQLCRGHSTQR